MRKGTRFYACPHCESSFPLIDTEIVPNHTTRVIDPYPATTYRVVPCPGSGQRGTR